MKHKFYGKGRNTNTNTDGNRRRTCSYGLVDYFDDGNKKMENGQMTEVQQRPSGGLPYPPAAPCSCRHGPGFQGVDREKICPLLVRVFSKVGGHHSDGEFAVRGKEPKDEVQIYTWMDATLRELTDVVVKEVVGPEEARRRRRDAVVSFAFVYPTKRGRFVVREVGKTFSYPNAIATTRRPDSGTKSLCELNFQIGDYLDVAILFQ